jgi:hypothetical protein
MQDTYYRNDSTTTPRTFFEKHRASPERGTTKSTSPEAIPEALRRLPHWMGSRFAPRRGQPEKVDKPPYKIVPGGQPVKADYRNPRNWVSFEQAHAAMQAGDVDAIGFCFSDRDPFYVGDFDSIIDDETGELDERAYEVIHALNSYSELSVSGRGVHVVAEGTKPEYAGSRPKKLGFEIELYDSPRFLVLTGERLGGFPREPQHRQKELTDLCSRLWPKAQKMHGGRRTDRSNPLDLEDEELLARARRSRTGKKFSQLFDHGDTSGYESQSNADYALLNALIFWTGADRQRVADLFRKSALYRDSKAGKHAGYVDLSVENALASYRGPLYRPRDVKQAREQESTDPLAPYLALLLDPSFAAWRGRKGPSAYKAYAAAVAIAAENGVVGDEGELRLGCDTRRLAEVAGLGRKALRESALPQLVKLRLLSWRRGKGRKAGTFVLKNPKRATDPNKVSTRDTDFIGVTSAHPQNALRTVGLLIRMRSGSSRSAPLLRAGMAAMFCAVAMSAGGPSREYTVDELAEATGRRARDLDSPRREDTPLKRLKRIGVVRERTSGCYSLTDRFRERYQEHLDLSGITYSERAQRRRHAADREARDRKIPADTQTSKLRGKEHMNKLTERRIAEDRERFHEYEKRKVGMTPTLFIHEEIDGKYGVRARDLLDRWRNLHGGQPEEIWRAIRRGPFKRVRVSGHLFIDLVTSEESSA